MAGLIIPFNNFVPRVDPSAFIAPNATLIGDVDIGANASIGSPACCAATGRASRSREQQYPGRHRDPHRLARRRHGGRQERLGRPHGAVARLHVEDDAFIGMHATVLDNCVVESGAMVAAGALLPPNKG